MPLAREVSRRDGWYDASQHLDDIHSEILAFDQDEKNERSLESLDLFAGSANFFKESEAQGKSSMAIDVLHDEVNHDVLTKKGFCFVLHAILSMVTRLYVTNVFLEEGSLFSCSDWQRCLHLGMCQVEYGWIMCGSPCGLFVFMSSSYHMRSVDFPYGDQDKPKIRASNQLVINLVILLAIAHSRRVFFLYPNLG